MNTVDYLTTMASAVSSSRDFTKPLKPLIDMHLENIVN